MYELSVPENRPLRVTWGFMDGPFRRQHQGDRNADPGELRAYAERW
jgi:hypothetical protein